MIQDFYSTAIQYLDQWVTPFKEVECFQWYELKSVPEWEQVEKSCVHINSKLKQKIDSATVFDELSVRKSFLSEMEYKQYSISTEERWTIKISHCQTLDVSVRN